MAFTWYRTRGGASASDATDQVLTCSGPSWEMETGTTIRALIVTYVVDLFATGGKTGTVNTKSPLTLGVVEVQSDEDAFSAPPGPKSNPDFGWRWWDACVFDNGYGFTTNAGSAGVVIATGKIIREAPFALDNTFEPWVKLYFALELEDPDEEWSSYAAQAWFQVLTSPTLG